MNTILVIDTGGTFNKIYDPVRGQLVVDSEATALQVIAQKWMTSFEILPIIGKDSLDMTSQDRLELMLRINQSEHEKILIIHGTDTMHITAEYLAEGELEKRIVLTGAMVPFNIDPVEATANFASAYTFLATDNTHGVYIAMHGLNVPWHKITKDKEAGRFVLL
jgi:L-asparaginase